jgi:glycosyltransferase involved in cell wall biosynthesis
MLPRYAELGASSRLRMMQYVPALQAAGVRVEVSPLLDNGYVRGMYAGSVSVTGVARSYWQRLRRTWALDPVDVVWLEKEAWPWIPEWLEVPLLGRTTKLVVDYDDAIFHRYDAHHSSLVRGLLGNKIDAIMRRANLVTAGNDYLAQRARSAGSGRVEWLPTVVDLQRYPLRVPEREDAVATVGWIGSPSTADYLRDVAKPLAPMQAAGMIRCVAIGARPDQLEGTPFEVREWREDNEVEQLQGLDIGIMPLPDAQWERGKCGYKLIQYMACGLPVVASPVGANMDIVEGGKNGFLASSDGQWTEAIGALAANAGLRRSMGEEGRRRVEQTYCVQAQANRLVDMLNSVATGGIAACVD